MNRFCLALAVVWPGIAAGDDTPIPALFDIIADKVALHTAPDPVAPIRVELAPINGALEVIGVDATGEWVEVSAAQGKSWVRLSALSPRAAIIGLPDPLVCVGTDPAWRIERREDVVFLDFLDGYLEVFEFSPAEVAGGNLELSATGDGTSIRAEIQREACRDGISDIRYGLSVSAEISLYGSVRTLNGCCSLRL